MGNSGNDRRIDNIEFTVSDIARSREFYGQVFGWTFTDYGSTYCEFSDGRLTGGFAKGDPMNQPNIKNKRFIGVPNEPKSFKPETVNWFHGYIPPPTRSTWNWFAFSNFN